MTKTATVQAQQKWECMELTRKTETYLVIDLNKEGQQGWELVSVIHDKNSKGEMTWTAFLKRPHVAHGSPLPTSTADAEVQAPPDRKIIVPPRSKVDVDEEELNFQDE